MHIFGIVAFLFTFSLGLLALIKKTDPNSENLALFIPYGILVFFLNLFYLKAIRLSREDYEDQLKKEKEYSQSLLRSQKRFLRYAVHETNTPLAIIMANIELYEMEVGKHPTLQNIEAATKNIFGIYDDLSYLTKQDKINYPKQKILFNEFIHSRVSFFDIVARQSGLHFKVKDSTTDSTLYFNETKLQRIVDNNITNAIKYTRENETIYIRLFQEENELIFEISSNSTIIEDPEQVFNAYYRENNSQEGLGLGLNLVRSICNKEEVNITLTSTKEHTSFIYHFKEGKK
jgi:signal transduction histidine kinase